MGAAQGFEEFVAIVEAGSLTGAAAQLGLPRPTLSRRLARLEERLGVRLLHRTTRRMKLTPQGDLLYPRARRIVQNAAEAEAEVQRLDGVPRGLLRVSVPSGMPAGFLSRWLVEFLGDWPEVRVELVGNAMHVDLVEDGFDVALRVGPIEDPSLVVRTLAHDASICIASPEYLKARGTPESPEDLSSHNCIVGFKAGVVPKTRWPLEDGGWVPVSGSLSTNQMGLRMHAAMRHLGIALVIKRLAMDEITRKTLTPVLPGVVGQTERLSLVYPDRAFLDPKVRVFVDFLSERIQAVRAARTFLDPG